MQADPIGLLGGGNIYIYAAANPERFTDFFGLEIYDTYAECKRAAMAYLAQCLEGARKLYDDMMTQFSRTCQISCSGYGDDYGGHASCMVLCEESLQPAKALVYLQYMAVVGACYTFYAGLIKMCDRSRDCRNNK